MKVFTPGESATDLLLLRDCRIEEFSIGELARIPLSARPVAEQNYSPKVYAGSIFSAVISLRSRLPIKELRFTIKSAFQLSISPLHQVIYPEKAMLLPDRVGPEEAVDVAANSCMTFLLSDFIASDIAPGKYPVVVEGFSQTHAPLTMEFILEVLPFATAVSTEEKIVYWPHWETFARQLKLTLWSEEFWHEAEKYLREMARGGMNVAMASICHDPFRYPLPPEYHAYNHYPSMIQWHKTPQGWSFDYTIYDRYIRLNHQLGIDREIECHSMLPCKNQPPFLCYTDDETGTFISRETCFDAPDYIEAWSAFLADFLRHNQELGWDRLLTICPYDEPANPESFASVARLVKKIAPSIRISAAISSDKAAQLCDVIDIATLHLVSGYSTETERLLRQSGVELRWYNCCTPMWGNTLFGCSLEDAYRQSWIGYAGHYQGYLRWSVVDWPDDVLHNPGFNWPSGDTHLLYPGSNGPLQSLRWHAALQGKSDLDMARAKLESLSPSKRRQFDDFAARLGFKGELSTSESIGAWRRELFDIFNHRQEIL